jgi:aminomethyltransferase
MSDTELRRTPLHAVHRQLGGRMVPFAGYEMPVQYSGVVDEHRTVRSAVGLFDVSHMGEVEFRGPGASETVDRIVTNHVSRLDDGQACYTVMCKEDGGILDDLVVYKYSSERVLICVNAANRQKDVQWMKAFASAECAIEDTSETWAQIAVQGPKAAELVAQVTSPDPTGLSSYRFIEGSAEGAPALLARTGYTGEDGFELYVPAERAETVWGSLIERGAPLGVKPAGLGARDSLRLEMCFPLYGNDIDETTQPYEAGLGWVVKLKKPAEYPGKEALRTAKAKGSRRKLVPLELETGIARGGYPVVVDGQPAGRVTSGTKGPSVGRSIALAYVPATHSAAGSQVEIEIRGTVRPARVVERPFYRRPKPSVGA